MELLDKFFHCTNKEYIFEENFEQFLGWLRFPNWILLSNVSGFKEREHHYKWLSKVISKSHIIPALTSIFGTQSRIGFQQVYWSQTVKLLSSEQSTQSNFVFKRTKFQYRHGRQMMHQPQGRLDLVGEFLSTAPCSMHHPHVAVEGALREFTYC